ncbi:MAG: riboflavin synthase [Bacteroidetes bacterium]|nr:riboflavin synthase [Bacteroidota bacterium]
MFTGIIETTGVVKSLEFENGNLYVKIQSSLSNELKIDQSVAHNGICLTVIQVEKDIHTVCAVIETITKTNIGLWAIGDEVNIERCTQLNGRMDGHIVQGHIDTKASCINRKNLGGNWNFTFSINDEYSHLIVEKGSIAVNGVSLTCFNISNTSFEVAIIPYTFEHTNFKNIVDYSLVNIEFDIIGKYVARMVFNGSEGD